MALYLIILQLHLLCFTWSTSASNSLSIEDQLQRLTENYNELKEALAVKDTTRLEEKVIQLEEKVAFLEEKVIKQESLLMALQDQQSSKLTKSVSQQNVKNQDNTKRTFFRTCQQIYDYDSEIQSGWYWIDPDGQEIGDDPIYVYCDVNDDQVTTSIPHDTEDRIEKEHCVESGCYQRKINYNATMMQMIALAELSEECHQSFRYDCIEAPFEFDGEQYSWWDDRNGDRQFFWAGFGAAGQHTCQCGIEMPNDCIDINKSCNCDSALTQLQTDSGIIRATELLPVTQLNFGRLIGSGQHTLGRFECTGKVTIEGIPTSCADLWHLGHTLKGIYSVRGEDNIQTVNCDFTKLPSDPSIQTLIGYNDVKTTPIYFYVEKLNPSRGGIVTYEIPRVNQGEAMNIVTGKFEAPYKGIYSFAFTSVAYVAVTAASSIKFALRKSLEPPAYTEIGHAQGEFSKGSPNRQTLSLHAILELEVGDKIWVEEAGKVPGSAKASHAVLDDGNFVHYTHFSGMLLKEYLTFE